MDGSSSSGSGGASTCCLLDGGRRCTRPASSAAAARKLHKANLFPDPAARHTQICSVHKKQIAPSAKVKALRKAAKDSGDEAEPPAQPRIRLELLPAAALRRAKKALKVQTRPGLSKSALAEAVGAALAAVPVDEKETLTFFLFAVKTGRNRLDQKAE